MQNPKPSTISPLDAAELTNFLEPDISQLLASTHARPRLPKVEAGGSFNSHHRQTLELILQEAAAFPQALNPRSEGPFSKGPVQQLTGQGYLAQEHAPP